MQQQSASTGATPPVKRWISAEEACASPEPENPVEPLIYRGITHLWPLWHAEAKCLGDIEDLHFGGDQSSYPVVSSRRAKELCKTCPVFTECLTAALTFHEEYGVWAGTTRKERLFIFKDIAEGYITILQVVSILTARRDHGRRRRKRV